VHRALGLKMQLRARITMKEMPVLSASTLLKIAGNACAAALSLIHVRRVLGAMKARASGAT
jgi:hypothetical protein